MAGDIAKRLERTIREEDERNRDLLRAAHESARGGEQAFAPVREAAKELREALAGVANIHVAVGSDSVWITLADREVRFWFDAESGKFAGEEGAHSWYDGEPQAQRYVWDTAEACIESLIRVCARYARMARAIRTSLGTK